MLTHFGLNPEITATLFALVSAQYRMVMELAWCRYKTKVYTNHLRLPAGTQYRLHIRNGGYRC